MRIGIFSECYDPTQNGVVTSIHTFKSELEKRGHEVFVFAPGSKDYKDQDSSHVFRFPSVCVWPVPEDYPICLPQLSPRQIAKIKDLKLDIIHTQHLFNMGKLGLKIGRQMNIPVVHTYHTLITEYTHYAKVANKLAKKVVISLSRKYCNSCDQIVTPSGPMRDVLYSYGIKTPIEVIPTGINLKEFENPFSRQDLFNDWKVPQDKKILLYLSRVAKEKNIGFLFWAVKLLKKKRKDFHLLMVGGGPALENLKQKSQKMQIDDVVTFTDMQKKPGSNRFFGAADIFVFPSFTETQGIVIAEAMASGIPPVAINKLGPTDIIQNGINGYLTDLKIDDFLGKIEYLLDHEEARKQMGLKAIERAHFFSTQNCADKLENLYEGAIARHRSK